MMEDLTEEKKEKKKNCLKKLDYEMCIQICGSRIPLIFFEFLFMGPI